MSFIYNDILFFFILGVIIDSGVIIEWMNKWMIDERMKEWMIE